jgi:4-amino-4-deoxy-L-arabinose transferase-like glycosyltransferase
VTDRAFLALFVIVTLNAFLRGAEYVDAGRSGWAMAFGASFGSGVLALGFVWNEKRRKR